ncbi:glycoside hydrolase [Neocallimastix californiae]|uniref:Beta-xylanase n=2 Tax=Neocallimastix californiae TaxID=1754190 RepID=A0A1Y2C7Q1_9FUNG|nr:glycoside hydrolase [Neocallimastix californiae]|eukprot:ORY42966.1 glycoside hydrolase [Neocallimastix californiae]
MRFINILTIATTLLAAGSVNAYDSLKSKAGNFRIGVAANAMKFNNQAYVNAMSNFNYMVAENDCKMVGIQPQQGKYNFSACDRHYNKAKELGMAFRGHCLIWHSMPPQWFQNLKGNALKNAIVDHINKTLKYYEGKIDTWDVVNEAIDDSSNGPQWKMRPSFLYQNVPDFVDLAFKTARAASPRTKLFYNDYNTEGIYGKSEAVFNFVKDMKSRGIPIDGVGLQYHVSTQAHPQYNKINDLIGRYCKLGLQVHITEMDVKSGGNAQAQASVYSDALKACLNNSCCTAFLVWGVGDNDSWLGANEAGLLFNGSYQPKASYNALLQTLGGGRSGDKKISQYT